MARVFTDNGAEFGDLAFWDATTGMTASAANPRSGVYSYAMVGGTASKTFSALSELYLRLPVWAEDDAEVFRLRSGTSLVASVTYDSATGILTARISTTLVGTATIPMPVSTWRRLEAYLKIDNTVGRFVVKVEGTDYIDFTGDTLVSALTTVNNLFIDLGAGDVYYFDDIALNDTTGLTDNSWCGEERMVVLLPDGAGDSTEWTPLAGNNYTNVNERPPDGDTSYNYTAIADNLDLYTCLPFDATDKAILRVFAESRARGEVGGEALQLVIKTGGTAYNSASRTLTTAYARQVGTEHTTNPFTSAEWTDSDLDNIQGGPESK